MAKALECVDIVARIAQMGTAGRCGARLFFFVLAHQLGALL
jgi:hypothetical protein